MTTMNRLFRSWGLPLFLFFSLGLTSALAGPTLRTAQKLIEMGQYREAEQVLRQLKSQDPSNDQIRFALGDLYLRFQAYPEAVAEYGAVLSRSPRNFQALMSLGVADRAQGDLKRAIASFRAANDINPNSILVHQNLAVAYSLAGDNKQAASEYELLMKLDPKGNSGLELAKLYRQTGDRAKAEQNARRYLKTHPEDAEGWNTLALLLDEKRDFTRTWEASENAVKFSPRNIPIRLTHAKIALEQDTPKSVKIAASDARLILGFDPANAQANQILLKANEKSAGRDQRLMVLIFVVFLLACAGFLYILWRKKEEQESRKRKLVENWDRQLGELNDLDKITEFIFTHCAELFNLPKGIFFLMNREETQLSCAYTNFKVVLTDFLDVKTQSIAEWRNVFQGRPMTTAQAFRTNAFSASLPDAKRVLEKQDIRMLVPFFSKNKLLGLLALGGITRREFRDRMPSMGEQIDAAYLFSQRAATAIETSSLYELSMIDEQTNIFNKRFFTQVLSDEIKRFDRYQQPVSLLMIDIDRFKDLNDTFGHPLGDSVLREMAQALRENIRQGMDSVFRYGGEEFTVILPATAVDKARDTAERIRASIATYAFVGLPAETRVTISVGVASFPEHANSDWELLQAADQALYQSKKDGRNCVTVSDRMPTQGPQPMFANTSAQEQEP